MKIRLILISLALAASASLAAQNPGNVFLYSPGESAGMHAALKNSSGSWTDAGQVFSSDYSAWGSEKKMYDPYIAKAPDGTWRAVFAVNDYSPCFAVAYSDDLLTWRPQDYPRVSVKNIKDPFIRFNPDGSCEIFFESDGGRRYVSADKSYRHFSADKAAAADAVKPAMDKVTVDGKEYEGNLVTADAAKISAYFAKINEDAAASAEKMADDSVRFKGLTSALATITIEPEKEKVITDKLIGVFFEDISFAADGGLYAELVRNRDFEYSPADHKDWEAVSFWNSSRKIEIATEDPLSANNPHYIRLSARQKITNEGFDGIPARWGSYDFSMFMRNSDGKANKVTVKLMRGNKTLAKAKIRTSGTSWKQYHAALSVSGTDGDCVLRIVSRRKADADMISLFPSETFKGHGLRTDLAETIAALHPKFVRFPGGCMSHGQGLDNIYHWNESVGPLQDRKPAMNIWNYHQTRGLGFYEYFQFCEDIEAEPLPVLAAGVPCQNSLPDENGYGGQQGGIPMEEMPAYCQEILDMIEWANGDPATSRWAKIRADAGHPAPFNLKYIGVGNEDIVSTVFEERYLMISKAIREKYPEIMVIGTVGPFHNPSSDYVEGWKVAKANKDVFYSVDEHYYETTGWFLNHQDYYDDYDRNAPKVYLGEFASKTRTLESALAEAIHLANCERNGDVVDMTSYAPLLCNEKHQNWNPDMIYFTNDEVHTTPSYETQRMFSIYGGDRYIKSSVNVAASGLDSSTEPAVGKRVAASVVRDSRTGKKWLKVVNALPVPLKIDVKGLDIPSGASMETISGKVSDESVSPVSSTVEGPLSLPAYSFTVISL